MPRYEFRVHAAATADTEEDARSAVDAYLERGRALAATTVNDFDFAAELDEGSADIIDEE